MRTKFKAWTKPFLEEHSEVQLPLEEVKNYDNINLEIGSGKGQFILEMSKKFPDLFFIGIEKNITCAGFVAKKLVEGEIPNAKLINQDAEIVLNFVKEKSVSYIFLNFSDPWPKKKHHKRRLTSNTFLDKYFNVLKDDGKIIMKTDNVDLFEFTKELVAESKFKIVELDEDYDGSIDFDTCTEYEQSFREENVPIHRMVMVKKW